MWTNDGPAVYLTADKSETIAEGDARAAWLLVGAGGSIPLEEAEKYGLTGKKAKVAAGENKLKAEPPANKSGLTIERDASDKTIKLGKG